MNIIQKRDPAESIVLSSYFIEYEKKQDCCAEQVCSLTLSAVVVPREDSENQTPHVQFLYNFPRSPREQ